MRTKLASALLAFCLVMSAPSAVFALCTSDAQCNKCQVCVQSMCIPKFCRQPTQCETGTASCDVATGNCSYDPNTGAACNDGNACTHTDRCQSDKTCKGTS